MRRWLGVVGLAACTAAEPGAPEPTPEPAPSSKPETARSIVPTTDLGVRVAVQRLEGARFLLTYCTPEPAVAMTLALATGLEGHVWESRLPSPPGTPDACSAAPVVAAGVAVLPVGTDPYRGAIGIDLERGEEVWRTAVVPAGADEPGQQLQAEAFGDHVLHVLDARSSRARKLLILDARTGALTGDIRVRTPSMRVTMPGWLAHAEPGTTKSWTEPWDWVLRAADEPSAARPLGPSNGACALDDRLYTVTVAGLTRTRPGAPGSQALTPVWLAPETQILGCDRRGDEDVIWLSGQALGVAPAGDVQWHIDLEPWSVHSRGAALPPVFVARAEGGPDRSALMIVDPARGTTRAVTLDRSTRLHNVVSDARHTWLELGLDADAETTVLAALDARGELVAAVDVGRHAPMLRDDSALAGELWLFASEHAQVPAPKGRRWSDLRLHLDGATLAPRSPAPVVLRDATAAVLAALARTVADPQRPANPPRPAADRGPGPGPPWDAGPALALARTTAGAPKRAAAQLLAWHREVGDDGRWAEHALVVVEHVDGARRPVWIVGLLHRGNVRVAVGRDDDRGESPGLLGGATPWLTDREAREWAPVHRPDGAALLRRFWRRPTDAELQHMLASHPRWGWDGCLTSRSLLYGGFEGLPEERTTIVDGNVIDAAWRALTGEAPSRGHDPAIERPD